MTVHGCQTNMNSRHHTHLQEEANNTAAHQCRASRTTIISEDRAQFTRNRFLQLYKSPSATAAAPRKGRKHNKQNTRRNPNKITASDVLVYSKKDANPRGKLGCPESLTTRRRPEQTRKKPRTQCSLIRLRPFFDLSLIRL